MHREPESADKPVFPQIQLIIQTTIIDCATQLLLSDVLHCRPTNMNTHFIDFIGNNITLQAFN